MTVNSMQIVKEKFLGPANFLQDQEVLVVTGHRGAVTF